MTVGTRVRRLRQERNISAEQLAVAAGVSVSTVSRLELGNKLPKIPLLEAIARELGTDAPSLLREAS